MISEHGALFPAPSWRFIRPGKNDPWLPPLVSYLSVESDTATISHQPRSLLWHPSGGLWEYFLGWNEPNTSVQRWKVALHAFPRCTSKNTNFSWSLSNQTDKKITYPIPCMLAAYFISVSHAGGDFRNAAYFFSFTEFSFPCGWRVVGCVYPGGAAHVLWSATGRWWLV